VNTVLLTLSPESCVHLEVALSRCFTFDEELYAHSLSVGIAADDEEMVTLAQSIGGQRVLLEVLHRALAIRVVLPKEE
jgi:hypothetical protein